MSLLEKRSFSLGGHRTSVALEAEFWLALEACALARGQTLAGLIASADQERVEGHGLASALRLEALRSLKI